MVGHRPLPGVRGVDDGAPVRVPDTVLGGRLFALRQHIERASWGRQLAAIRQNNAVRSWHG
jgi:hypothetical protein